MLTSAKSQVERKIWKVVWYPHVLYYLFMPNITTNHAITYTNFNLSEIKTVCAMLGVLLIAQKFEHIFLLTETRKVELCRC